MTRHLPVAHLSSEVVAAVADGVLRGVPLARAERHLAECAECAQDVVAQRQATFALRAASAPPLPGGLAERLLGLPQTLPSDPARSPAGLTPDGRPLFAAYQPPARPAAFLDTAADSAGGSWLRGGPLRRSGR